jgi:hypothetical protein
MWKDGREVGVAAEAIERGATTASSSSSEQSLRFLLRRAANVFIVCYGKPFFEMHLDDQAMLVVEVWSYFKG